jgi:hypothetical protein
MTAFRLISLSSHSGVEMALGLALLAAPFVLGFGAAGIVAGLLVGFLLVGLALSAATLETHGSVAAHHAYDWGIVLGLIGAALALGFLDETVAALTFLAVATAELALALTTRYSTAR